MNRLLDVKNPFDLKSWIRFWTLQKYVISAFVVIKFNRNIMYSRHPITWTLGKSNSPLTRSNFCFPSDHFYDISPSITRTMFKARDKLIKKIVVYCSPKQWIFLNINRVFFVFTFCQFSVNIVQPCILIKFCCLKCSITFSKIMSLAALEVKGAWYLHWISSPSTRLAVALVTTTN